MAKQFTAHDVLAEHGFVGPRAVEKFQRAWWGDGTQLLAIDNVLGPKTRAAMRTLPRLSAHFEVFEVWDWRESDCGVHRWLIGGLERLRREIGVPLLIRSGYRTTTSNSLVGGANASLHLHGLAADLRTVVYEAQVKRTGWFSGIGLQGGDSSRVLHVDARHVLGADSPTPGARPSRPVRWRY